MRTNWKAKLLLADRDHRTKRCSLRRLVGRFVRYSPRSGGFPLNWDLDVWRFGISFCWWRTHKLGLSWANGWPHPTDNPYTNVMWYRYYFEMFGSWKFHVSPKPETANAKLSHEEGGKEQR